MSEQIGEREVAWKDLRFPVGWAFLPVDKRVGQECPTYILEFNIALVSGMALATGDCPESTGKHRTARAVTL